MSGKIHYLSVSNNAAQAWLCATSPLFTRGAFLLIGQNPRRLTKQIRFWQKAYLPASATLRPILFGTPENLWTSVALLQKNQPSLILIGRQALRWKIPTQDQLTKKAWPLRLGEELVLKDFLRFLQQSGYQQNRFVEQQGTFAHRGNIIDLYPLFAPAPLRLELDGNKIDRLTLWQSNKVLTQARVPPLSVVKPLGTLRDWLKPQNKIILDTSVPDLVKNFSANPCFVFVALPSARGETSTFPFRQPPLFFGDLVKFKDAVKKWRTKNYRLFLASAKIPPAQLPPGVQRLPFALRQGFKLDPGRLIVWSDQEIFGPLRRRTRQARFQIDYTFIAGLTPGMYVVHLDHGIGRFVGMVQKQIDEITREYYLLEYAQGDKLFLPIDQADRITRYVGKSHPALQRLHSSVWYQIKKRVKEDAKKMAQELLALQALRHIQKGFIFAEDTPAQQKLENTFLYTETRDQEKAIWAVKKDMESPRPMDRLICGDVGFGKTEVAIRAAFKAVENKKQVCLLAPTTILVQQHYDTFRKRLAGFPITVRSLSRFQTKREQVKIVRDLQAGKIDIVIGTHRLLSSDVKFSDLGLVIIDEEQRFGVRHKEKLKAFRANVDILTLSATPIPRTLHFVLAGLRDISAIRTPPPGRRPVKTFVLPFDLGRIKKAIMRELERGGQIYYLYNKVETILAQAKKIQKLHPQARVEVAHGQLSESDLATVMHEFDQGKIDILVATTIIENGLDLPNVNTLIVDDAPQFGLSQLHQIRGRIGRSFRQAYAYFFYHRQKLPPLAQKRLATLLEMQGLGAGFKIALRDLELRGAGNLLGREQSGNVNAVGLHLYTQLLQQAIRETKTHKVAPPLLEVKIDLPLDARIPAHSMPSERQRLALYHELSTLTRMQEIRALRRKLTKKQGSLSPAFYNLFKLIALKILARDARIKGIETQEIIDPSGQPKTRIILDFAEKPNWKGIEKLLRQKPQWIIGENKLKIDFAKLGKDWIESLGESLQILAKTKKDH